MSLRGRFVLVAAAAVAAAVAIASVVVYFIVQNELRGQVDRSLQDQARQIVSLPGLGFATPIGNKKYALHTRGLPFGSYFQLVDAGGSLYLPEQFDTVAPQLPGTAEAQKVAENTKPAFFSDTHVQGKHVRVLTTRATPYPYAIQIAVPLSDVDHELGKIELWLLLVAIGGVGAASVAGVLVARAALRPIRKLSDTAENVRLTRDLTQRIDVHGNDELSSLASTFNAMLESLDDAAQRQRQLVQDASHELRTPLTSLRTNIEVLAMGDGLPAEDREQLLKDVVAQLTEMTALIGELTDLARGEGQETVLEEVRIDLLVGEAIERTRRNHPDVPIDAELEPVATVGSPANLERAIGNLLDNAAKWSPAGASIEVVLTGGVLTVRDHGPGIPDADLPYIFDRFYRATSARSMPGSGLGLAIVRQVAESHGGSITVERPDGGGTLMRLTLPARPLAPASDGA